ncbi:ankyrin repeat domain-containing protein [Candidatus Wolbachia massiliensis]|uniref:Ankyrin repeat domain-containing protein n=1 Tax=Candidatus Wolbachia massiliensis TaxID=1845000 RepID=A0A7L7YLH1_9RICK|nr:ankyrin repeat domain-containing protein [Candidatus Wolbachia massiliensis]QOD38083.1 ankyrin repeat domain-containing protein [Candidatus Wolbachia massiliensis]
MKSVLYFALLFVVLWSPNLSAAEQFEEKKIDTGESSSSVHEDADIKENLKQDLPKNVIQENEPESFKSNSTNVDKLNVEEAKTEGATNEEKLQHNENKAPETEKAINGNERNDKDLPDLGNNLPKESKDVMTPSLPSVDDKEVNKDLALPPNASLNENTTDLQKDLQVDKKVDVEENKSSENSTDKLSEKKEEKAKGQPREEKVKEPANARNGQNQVKPTTKEGEEGKEEEKKNSQKWTKLNREPVKKWYHESAQSKPIYKRQYDNLNEHLSKTIFIDDYIKQFFYCIKKNNLICLRGIINKLEKMGLTAQEVLKFRNKLGDTPLIYAVKQGGIDAVRFLLLQGANPEVVNNSLHSPINIAIERGRVDMINAIAEMMLYLSEHKRIDNKEDLEMYDWAVRTKENNELQCNED